MASIFYDDEARAGESAPPVSVQWLIKASGAAVSLALMAGIGWWGYQLAVRDVAGVPVVRAVEGPMRIAPDDPGGRQAEYQGLAVNAVAEDGAAGGAGERIILAPDPVELAREDTPATAPAAEAASADGGQAGGQVTRVAFDPDDPLAGGGDDAPETRDDDAASAGGPEDAAGLSASPRPRARPEGDLVARNAADAIARRFASAPQTDVDPATLTAGTRLVQVGAFDDPETARQEWERLADRFEGLFDDHRRVIQQARSGGSAFYRLRVHGFEDEAEARRFCSVLLAENAPCIPVLIR